MSASILVIPYGIDRWTMAELETGAVPRVAIDRASKEPLRLYQHDFADTSTSDGDAAAAVVKGLTRLCRPYDRLAAAFLDGYAAYANGVLAGHRAALENKLARFDGLYRVEDWFYSVPLPLPRAFLFAPNDGRTFPRDEADFVQVEFAFWLGDKLLAIVFADGRMTPGKAAERISRLARGGIAAIEMRSEDVAAATFFARIFPAAQLLSALGELPVGPRRPVKFLADSH